MLPKVISKKIIDLLKNVTIINIILVGATTAFVSGFGFFKEIVIANKFGLSELLDTYYIALLMPTLISGVFLGSFQSVFIPNYVSELKTGKNIGSFQSTSFLMTLGVSVIFFLIAYIFTDLYLELFFKGHTQQYYALIKTQFYLVAPCILFWGFSSLINGLLTIDNEFKYSSLSPIFTPVSIIICLVFFDEYLGVNVLALGTLIGSVLSFFFTLTIAIKRKIIYLKSPDFNSVNIRMLFKQLPAKLSSSILNGVNPLVDQFFSAQLVIGSIAALNYGIKIPAFAIGIATVALGNVLLPYFSKNAIENPVEVFKKLKTMIRYVIIGSSLAMIIGIIISTPIISLLFERNAFSNEDTNIVSKVQQMYLLQIPSYIIGIIMVKFLTSINKNNFMVFTSFLSLILNIGLNYILIEYMEVYGLALATSLVSIINSLILYFYIQKINKSYV